MDILTKIMYVPDPKTWINYYKNANHFSVNGYKNQRGGGLMNSPKEYLIPIENNTREKPPITDLPKLEFISPAEQVVQQAKDGLKQGIKRKANPVSIIPLKKRRGNTSKARMSKKLRHQLKREFPRKSIYRNRRSLPNQNA